MGCQHNHEDLNGLMGYIEQLEISLAKKDELLAAKDRRIDTLEYKVTVAKNETSVAPVFRARARYRVVTPTALHGDRNQSVASTPNQVSDDSGEVEPESQGSLSHRLSHVSQTHSLDEDSTMEHTTSDGRWNIPFDGSFEDLTAKSSSGKGTVHGNTLEEIGFIPISEEVSDESGEVEPESQGSLSHGLSHISQAYSTDEDSTMEHTTSDGRWNIPFDGSIEDLTAKSASGMGTGHGNALKEIDFIPISDEGRWCFSGGFRVTPVQPVASSYGASAFAHAAKKGLLKDKKRCIWLCLQVLED